MGKGQQSTEKKKNEKGIMNGWSGCGIGINGEGKSSTIIRILFWETITHVFYKIPTLAINVAMFDQHSKWWTSFF